MGYRISLYRVPKELVDKHRNVTSDEFDENYDEISKDLEYEEIQFDTLANVLDTGKELENNLCSRIFTNRLRAEVDRAYYTISREQLLNIIEYIRVHSIYEFRMKKSVDYDKKEIGYNGKNSFYFSYYCDDKFKEAVRQTCMEARQRAEMWNEGYRETDKPGSPMKYFNINVRDNNKWLITNAMSYDYYIFNIIHILKIFDWEHDYLVALGG